MKPPQLFGKLFYAIKLNFLNKISCRRCDGIRTGYESVYENGRLFTASDTWPGRDAFVADSRLRPPKQQARQRGGRRVLRPRHHDLPRRSRAVHQGGTTSNAAAI